ncbi:oxaloacetate decarboxylase [Pseudohalocynthiibacter aestuariivivens]|jgi:2-methylisocitrate lyase-like PEP mutase family enzyme|uniref:Oxaloacetate decarboxylase n=1 Tax=Pseudohalocynthiibacter aestuariivivens TaxID=1591409 RepID=A0ABV5JHY0_9RHOB|nr:MULTISPECIES: isocitrate lyase/phosphoenolpyruvate mutase family protein [Pseudohalocynthiibacter]MBS9716214.1 isocitrate lyase/phosphoenolpyruvate mutase family protein [Pseudohalocynthiibacter aestuariivivens]MCK0100979.1 isocitrate lyase/phosphoenolpyruvate mutase family protein [Pseudohalocynthiibacter sp. F2068]
MSKDIGATFRDLHRPGDPFILANAWDIGSAKMLVALGAEAIATSSAAHAFTLGRPDMGNVTRDEALSHAADLVAAVNVPVSGDFENGFGEAPDTVAETVRLAAEVGLAGISVEDSHLPSVTPYNFDLAVERIRAAAAAARALPKDFVLVARADGIMNGQYDIEEALRRLKAFEGAGADCLYAPLPATMDDMKRICASTSLPINALAAGPYTKVSKAEFAAAGVARISLGSALARVTHRAIKDAADAMFGDGDFSLLSNGISGGVIDKLLR